MRGAWRLLAVGLAAVTVAAVAAGCAGPKPVATGALDLEGKRVVMILAHDKFRDEELTEPQAVLEAAGAHVAVACSSAESARGMLGMTVTPDIMLDAVDAADYDAVVFVGGAGAKEYWHHPKAHEIANQAVSQNKVLAAICLAPVTLSQAGVLKLKKATVWASEADVIEKRGAVYTGADVQVDGKIITANGPQASRAFGQAIAEALARP